MTFDSTFEASFSVLVLPGPGLFFSFRLVAVTGQMIYRAAFVAGHLLSAVALLMTRLMAIVA
jgi:hypothetical protein